MLLLVVEATGVTPAVLPIDRDNELFMPYLLFFLVGFDRCRGDDGTISPAFLEDAGDGSTALIMKVASVLVMICAFKAPP